MVHQIDLSGKNVLITGGGRGLGTHIARAYANAGANVVLTCESPLRLGGLPSQPALAPPGVPN